MRQRRKPSALEGELHVEMGLETDKTGEEERETGTGEREHVITPIKRDINFLRKLVFQMQELSEKSARSQNKLSWLFLNEV